MWECSLPLGGGLVGLYGLGDRRWAETDRHGPFSCRFARIGEPSAADTHRVSN
jgi:hypothetical protein